MGELARFLLTNTLRKIYGKNTAPTIPIVLAERGKLGFHISHNATLLRLR